MLADIAVALAAFGRDGACRSASPPNNNELNRTAQTGTGEGGAGCATRPTRLIDEDRLSPGFSALVIAALSAICRAGFIVILRTLISCAEIAAR
jgi:hypothetical protein